MKMLNSRWMKALVITVVVIVCLIGGGYLYLQHLIGKVESTLTGCSLESSNFRNIVDFDYDSGWIVVKAKVNGSEREFDFIFDSGAQTVFSDSLFSELGIDDYKRIGIKTDTAAHAFKNEIVSLESLELGGVKFGNIGAIVVESSEYDMLNCVSPYGIIGYNILQTCCFQIDYKKRQILITDRVDSVANMSDIEWIGYTTSGQETPIFPAIIDDNINVDLFFDTGYRGTVSLSSETLYENIGNQYPDRIAKYTARPTIDLSGGKDIESYQKMLFKTSISVFGSDTIEDIVVSVADIPETDYTGLIGSKFLENFIITLDYRNKRVGFLPNGIMTGDDRKTTFGLSYAPVNNRIIVSAVYKDSEAESRGILAGDEVISINGTSISNLDSNVFCDFFRGEFSFVTEEDSVLALETMRDGESIRYTLTRYEIF